jgi:hypothetical protein
MRLKEEDDTDISMFLSLIQRDFERDASYLIVKSRAIQLLQQLSHYKVLQNDTNTQETLIKGVIKIFLQQESEKGGDVHLQMCCIEYFKNFYNDH